MAVVETTSGKVEGRETPTHQTFLGIPFAASPTGSLRFAAPAPPAAWTGIRKATEAGHACPQPASLLPGMAPGPIGEDCLTLNVYTPSADGGRRPVLVWFHGGGFVAGSSTQALYEASRLAVRGDVVVVTANYRLGALGFLAPGAADLDLAGAVDNAGMLDQIAALRWVRDNVAAFGGDPAKVTIFGESAGGMSVATLLAMPAARGLYRRAIAQSGAAQATCSLVDATKVTDLFLTELGITRATVAKLRDLPADDIVAAQSQVTTKLGAEVFLPWAPVVDPLSLPVAPSEAIAAGVAKDVPLLTGTTLDEWRLFTFMTPKHRDLDEPALVKRIARRLEAIGHGDASELIAVYRKSRPAAPPWQIFDAIESDRHFRIPAIRLAESQSAHQEHTYMYLFTWPSPAAGGLLGACHAIELPFVFGTLDAPNMAGFSGSGPRAEQLAQVVMDVWLRFASGDADDLGGLAHWQRYEAEKRTTVVLDAESATAHDPAAEERAAWAGIL
ncbi:carboxylesterase/lipase family protein [Candidatus Binatia bacterium]|jgi:para-nitrobenzyl esterase|nr:carboxylesterase/lipase family protein [Candidatus Binatia bacterium]